VFLLPFPKTSMTPSGTPNFRKICRLNSVWSGIMPILAKRGSSTWDQNLLYQTLGVEIRCDEGPHISPSAEHNDRVCRRNRVRHDPEIGRALKQGIPPKPRATNQSSQY
jgi:hypothetical protein